ncbi:hypothetical protein ACTJJ0_02705 [Chitinophaga sp. 22321]|uniref:Calx-beta domain-containing protein n=1 Tax=Chitinophaga hostae TaxID=2831022 RepID=A0ABS5IU99_9BACT|nr:hypothetical protein [Chitinophaga hostae]MBS0026539.1 hypothetical protein [Chitinophaga hostae]
MKRILSLSLSILLVAALFTACSKNNNGDDTPDLPKGKTMKLTITATGLTPADYLKTTISGGTINGTEPTLYKLNGVAQTNQKGFAIDQSTLISGPVTIETVVPVAITSISMGGFSAAGHSFSIKIASVIDGKEQTAIQQAYTTTTFTKVYDFQ